MQIIPAIDIRAGRVVRLRQGRFDRESVYSDAPLEVARRFLEAGAQLVHLIDLDGARLGRPVNEETIRELLSFAPCEVGGGIRTEKDIERFLSYGAKYVIIGTAAIEKKDSLHHLVERFGKNLTVSCDVECGLLCIEGWMTKTKMSVLDLVKYIEANGVARIIYTNIAKDGTLTSPDFRNAKALIAQFGGEVIISGGVSSLEDIGKMKDLGAAGVVIGKALYEGRIDLKEAIRLYVK